MKRFLFIGILFALCLHFNQEHAQRYLPGMKGLQSVHGRYGGRGALERQHGFRLPYRGGVQRLHQERQPLGDWRGIPAQEVWLQGYENTSRTVHRRGRLLPEIPFGQAKDLFPVTGAVGTCRI